MTAQKQMTAAEYRSTPKKPSKYRAIRTEVDGIKFHSKGEALRWMELKMLERMGKITGLKRQVKYGCCVMPPLADKVVLLGWYLADFQYWENGAVIVEDYKGMDTPMSKWKRKHIEAQESIKILLTGPAAKRRRR